MYNYTFSFRLSRDGQDVERLHSDRMCFYLHCPVTRAVSSLHVYVPFSLIPLGLRFDLAASKMTASREAHSIILIPFLILILMNSAGSSHYCALAPAERGRALPKK